MRTQRKKYLAVFVSALMLFGLMIQPLHASDSPDADEHLKNTIVGYVESYYLQMEAGSGPIEMKLETNPLLRKYLSVKADVNAFSTFDDERSASVSGKLISWREREHAIQASIAINVELNYAPNAIWSDGLYSAYGDVVHVHVDKIQSGSRLFVQDMFAEDNDWDQFTRLNNDGLNGFVSDHMTSINDMSVHSIDRMKTEYLERMNVVTGGSKARSGLR